MPLFHSPSDTLKDLNEELLAKVNECHITHDMPLNLDDAMMLHSEATNFPPVFCATKPPVVGKDGRHVSFAASTFPLTGHTRTDAKP